MRHTLAVAGLAGGLGLVAVWLVGRQSVSPSPTPAANPPAETPDGVTHGPAGRGVAAKPGGGGTGNRSILGFAWDDANGNGLRSPAEEATEPVRARVRVALLDANQNEIDFVLTDWQGNYQFDVPDGKYFIQITRPKTHDFTTANMSPDDQDSDAVPVAGTPTLARTGEIVVSGADIENVDVGFVAVPLGTVSGRAWADANGDGIRAGESGFARVRVELHGTDGTPAGFALTDSAGNYTFTGVAPGEYVLYVEKPANAALSPKDVESDATDSDFDPDTRLTAPFTVAAGGSAVRDAGLRNVFGSVAGTVYFDDDLDGTRDTGEDGVADQGVELLDAGGFVVASAVTAADGSYRFDGFAPGSYTVRFTPDVYWNFTSGGPTQAATVAVGATATADAGLKFTDSTGLITGRAWDDTDRDGIQDVGEASLAGVPMLLLDADGNVLRTTTTGADGEYSFTWLAAGQYRVRVSAPGATGSPPGRGTDGALDSDFDGTGHTPFFTVAAWQMFDFDLGLTGFVPPPSGS